MKKKILFLYLFFTLFIIEQKIHASFFEPFPVTQNYGNDENHVYATQWDPSETYLAVGGVNYPTDLIIYQWDESHLYPKTTLNFGNGAYAVNWSPNGQYLAVGGKHGYNQLIIYKWDGLALTLTTSKYHGTQVNTVTWSPDGNTLAVGGAWGNNALALYTWDGSNSLTLTTSKYHGTQVNALAWHPDGTKLAVAGTYDAQDLILYSWNGSALTTLTTKDHGTQANTVAWSNSGNYLAIGGANTPDDIIIYGISGSTLTQVTTAAFDTQANTLQWSFDDAYLAIGGENNTTDLIVYKWTGATLTPITSSQTIYGTGVYAVNWTPYADYLAVAGNNGTNDITIYKNHGYLNGTKNNVTIPEHYLFTDGGYANGSVNLKNGCTLSNGNALTLALNKPFSGGLDAHNGQAIALESDLYLDSSFTLSPNYCGIYGQDHTVYLSNDLIIPNNTYLDFWTNVAIDGNGHSLILGNQSYLYLESNTTLTLKNLTLQNTHNTQSTPAITLTDSSSKLALDNIKLALSDDFYFTSGQLFIHNDIAFTGTSKFMYKSPDQSYITKNATLLFDNDTTFYYAPTTNNKNLLALQDASSCLYLSGSTLHVTHTGLQLTKGQLYLDDNVTFTSAYIELPQYATFINSHFFGNGSQTIAWRPDNNYIAIGTYSPSDGNELQIYGFNGTLLSKITGANYGTDGDSSVLSVAWRPDGNFLAIGGYKPTDGNEIQIYSFDGTTLTNITGADYGDPIEDSQVNTVTWNSTGNYLAVSGYKPTDGDQLQIFSFDGTNLVKITGANFENSDSTAYYVQWNTNNNTLATVTYESTSGTTLRFFNFDGTNLTQITSITYGLDPEVYSLAWSPNGNFIAANLWVPDEQQIKIYSFDGTTATEITSISPGNLSEIAWSPDGLTLATGGQNTSDGNVQFFDFNGASLTQKASSGFIFGTYIDSIAYSPNGNYLAPNKRDDASPTGYLGIYRTNSSPSYQSLTNSIVFGNAALGPDYDLTIKKLNNAQLYANGLIKYNNVH